MFLLVEFKFMDFNEPAWRFFIDYSALLTLFAYVGYYLKKMLTEIAAIKKKQESLAVINTTESVHSQDKK